MIGLLAGGIAVSGTAVTMFALNDANIIHLHQDELREYEAKFYVENQLTYRTGSLKRGTQFAYEQDTPVKERTPDGKVYQFIGWDLLGNGLPDILPKRIYSNMNAKAVFMRLPTLEKLLMDPDLVAKLAELLQNLNVQLTPEQIQKILDWLMNLGIDWENIDLSVLEQMLNLLNIDLQDFMDMSGLDLAALMAIFARPMFRYTTDTAGAFYFRNQSYGNTYENNAWAKADYYPNWLISEGSVNPLAYSTDKIVHSNTMSKIHFDMTYLNKGDVYPVPANEINNTQNLESDSYSLTKPTEIQPLEGYKYSSKYYTDGMQFIPACTYVVNLLRVMTFSNDAISKDELAYRQYVREHYLQVDDKYRSLFSSIAQENGIANDETYNYISQILQYFSKNYRFDYMMDAYPAGVDKILHFMNDAKVGIGSHFADASVMFFRTLGVPARAVNGYVDVCEVAGEEREVSGIQNHNWCEIYLDGIGWLSFDACLGTDVIPAEYSQYLFNSFETIDPELGKDKIVDLQVSTDKEYFIGDEFNIDDLTFTATYENGETRELTSDEITYVSSFNTYAAGEQTITAIVVQGTNVATASTTITVKQVQPEKLEIVKDSVRLKYFTGETIRGSETYYGQIFGKVIYNNKTSNYTADLSYLSVDMSTPGVKDVTFYLPAYPNIKDTLQITVIDEPDTPLESVVYHGGEIEVNPNYDLTLLNLTLRATYEDGLSRNVTKLNGAISYGDVDLSTSGLKRVTVYYTENGVTKSTTILVRVKNRSAIYIDADELDKVYDGYDIGISEMNIRFDDVFATEGQYVVITDMIYPFDYDGKSAGEYDVVYYFKIYDENNKDITKEYGQNNRLNFFINDTLYSKGVNFDYNSDLNVFVLLRTYNVAKRKIRLISNDISGVYTDADLDTAGRGIYVDYTVIDEYGDYYSLANNDYIDSNDIVWTGHVNTGGQSENTIDLSSIVIRDQYGNDVTSSYDIEFEPGIITYGEVQA